MDRREAGCERWVVSNLGVGVEAIPRAEAEGCLVRMLPGTQPRLHLERSCSSNTPLAPLNACNICLRNLQATGRQHTR